MRALRDLTRTRVSLVQTRTQAKNRVYKILEDTNLTLASVVSEVFGKSARRLLEALVAGARDAAKLSAMALGSWRRKMPQLAVALEGQCTAHHATLIAGALELVDVLGRQIVEIDQQLQALLGPMAPQLEQLDSIPGVNEITARDMLAEIGLDMTRFGSASRLAAWAGVSPGNNESAGKRRKGRTRRGHRSLRRVLVQCAWATRKTSTFVGRTFRRLEARLGGKKAAVAVAHTIVVILYHLLLEGTFYEEERYDRLVPRQEERERKRALKALERLGYAVTLEKIASSAGVESPITIRDGLFATHPAKGATTHGSGVPKRRLGFRGKFKRYFCPDVYGSAPRSPHRLDSTSQLCTAACACRYARWLCRAAIAMADAARTTLLPCYLPYPPEVWP